MNTAQSRAESSCCTQRNTKPLCIFLLLAHCTGLRKGELLALTWEDVDYDKKLLNVNKSRTGSRKDVTTQITTPKTKSSNRKIPINDFVIEALKAETTESEIVDKLLAKYDVDRSTAEKDVADMIGKLRSIGAVIDE